MALVIVTGLPCSGKSILAKKIETYLRDKIKNTTIRLVSDQEQLEWEGKNSIYMSIAKEKELRAWLKSEARRYINLNQVVILDCAAYIKGFRYELFCIAKEAKGHYCVVENLVDAELCWKWNEDLRDKCKEDKTYENGDVPEPYYNRETFDALIMRYEKCDESNRWDSPLFRDLNDNEKNLEKLFNIITDRKPLDPNKCTSLSTTSKSIFKPEKG